MQGIRRWFYLATLFASVGWADTPIFRCEVQGRVTYSDKACGPSATRSATGELNFYRPEPVTERAVPKHERASSQRGRSEASISEQRTRARQRCERIAARLDAIQTKLRRGYTIDEGNRLHDQRRQLEWQRRTANCR